MERKKIKNISSIGQNIKNVIESATYGTSVLIALTSLELNAFDYIINGSFNSFNSHYKGYTIVLLSPIIIGSLIKKLDPNSETAQDIDYMINDLKPKTRIRKK